MDPKAPRLASASLVIGGILLLLAAISFVAELGLENGFGLEEIILVVLAGICFTVWFFASRQRPVFEDIHQPSVQEQFEALDDLKTSYQPTTQSDRYGLETVRPQSENTKFLIATVLEQEPVQDTISMEDAFSALGTGESAQIAAEMARANPAPHAQTDQFREVVQSASSTPEDLARHKVSNVPLPGQSTAAESPDLPWLNKEHDFKSEGVASVPLPSASNAPISQPAPDAAPLSEPVAPQPIVSPALPDLSELPSSLPSDTVKPELPSLDDLFE
tara:strand:+ start:10826 stop:11650 length:825 start_codon:yes stop_codon:yes gene_type:complete